MKLRLCLAASETSGFYGNTFWTPPQGAANTIPAGNGANRDIEAD